MAPQMKDKAKRHKKRESRTEVSSDSDSSPESRAEASESENISPAPAKAAKKSKPSSTSSTKNPKQISDEEVEAAFSKFYMRRVTTEFADDLDKLRQAEDFKDDALNVLIEALQQGTGMFSMEEKRRFVADVEGKGKEG